LWAGFGKETPFGRKFSAKHSVRNLRSVALYHSAKGLLCAWKRKRSGIRVDVA
jgi:hypothetical protein